MVSYSAGSISIPQNSPKYSKYQPCNFIIKLNMVQTNGLRLSQNSRRSTSLPKHGISSKKSFFKIYQIYIFIFKTNVKFYIMCMLNSNIAWFESLLCHCGRLSKVQYFLVSFSKPLILFMCLKVFNLEVGRSESHITTHKSQLMCKLQLTVLMIMYL